MKEAAPLACAPVGAVRHAHLKRPPSALSRLLALTALLVGASALAQPAGLPEIELERLTLNSGASGSLLLGTGELLPGRASRLSLTSHYENDPLVLLENGQYQGSVVKHRLTGHLAWAYGLTDRVELSAQVPLLLMQRGQNLSAFNVGQPSRGLALGTPYLGLRVGILSQGDRASPVDLALGLNAGLPLGSADALARDRGVRLTPNLMVGRDFGPVRAALDLGMLMRKPTIFSDDAYVRDEVGNEVRLGAMLATTGEGLRGELDLIAYLPTHRESRSLEALAGVRRPLSRSIEAYAMVGAGFDTAPGTPTFRGLLGMAFTTPRRESRLPQPPCPPENLCKNGSCPVNGKCSDEPTPPPCPPENLCKNGSCPVDGKCSDEPTPPPCLPEKLCKNGSCPVDGKCSDEGPTETCPLYFDGKTYSKLENQMVFFDHKKAVIRRIDWPKLTTVAELLSKKGGSEQEKVLIVGHTSSVGSEHYNLRLSQERAMAVANHLIINLSVSPGILEMRGEGETELIWYEGMAKENEAASRRAEIFIPCKQGAKQQ
jgi:outer membrane protein OmpA-like peptidoglycan-associated protein